MPRWKLAGRAVFRVWRHDLPDGGRRASPWWFASAGGKSADGRFDLPAPMGTCYFGTRPEAAVLEALQMHLSHLPAAELRIRRLAEVQVPAVAPDAAMLTAKATAGRFGITAELWAGRDRALSQAWAQALRRDGWWALYGGISHDPSGQLRGVALFDQAGEHPPTHAGKWRWNERALHDVPSLHAALKRHGVVVRDAGQLPWAAPPNQH